MMNLNSMVQQRYSDEIKETKGINFIWNKSEQDADVYLHLQ